MTSIMISSNCQHNGEFLGCSLRTGNGWYQYTGCLRFYHDLTHDCSLYCYVSIRRCSQVFILATTSTPVLVVSLPRYKIERSNSGVMLRRGRERESLFYNYSAPNIPISCWLAAGQERDDPSNSSDISKIQVVQLLHRLGQKAWSFCRLTNPNVRVPFL